MPSILGCFLLLEKTPKPKHLGEERFTPSYKSARNPETGTEEQVLGGTSYWLACKLTSSYPLAQFKPSPGDGPAHCVLSPPTSINNNNKNASTGIHTGQHASGCSSVEALFQGVSR